MTSRSVASPLRCSDFLSQSYAGALCACTWAAVVRCRSMLVSYARIHCELCDSTGRRPLRRQMQQRYAQPARLPCVCVAPLAPLCALCRLLSVHQTCELGHEKGGVDSGALQRPVTAPADLPHESEPALSPSIVRAACPPQECLREPASWRSPELMGLCSLSGIGSPPATSTHKSDGEGY